MSAATARIEGWSTSFLWNTERYTGLVPPRHRPRVIAASLQPRQPFGEQRRLGAQGADAGMRHGDRAEVAALGLGGEIEPHGAAGHRSLRFAAVVRGGVDAPADALGHHRVIGGMELDEIDAIAPSVHGPKLGRHFVRHASEIERRS
jgi:hypothetical protein